ncbi:MAG TPA: YceI family protein [Mucilaginibacter sp.]|jgi:polyisoprenoid-binding protein YceI
MKKTIILLSFALLNAAAFAQTTWNSDKMHSKLQFTVTHLMVSDVDGEFKDFSATITAAKPDFSDARFQMTANTTSVSTGVDQRDAHLRTDAFFDVAKFPTMTFTSTNVTPTTSHHYKLSGNFTLHGVTKPVTFDLWYRGTITNPMSKADDAGFQVTGVIKRSDFNFGSGFGNAILSDEVAVKANGEFGIAK